MKHNLNSFLRVMAASLAFAASTQAQTPDLIINNFDVDTEAAQWVRWWGSAVQTYEFDSTVDANARQAPAPSDRPSNSIESPTVGIINLR